MTKGIIKILRPINLVITFLSVIIAAIISSSINAIDYDVILIAITSAFSLAAGNIINDIIDFDIDKINRPERVLPAGLISLQTAKIVYSSLVLIAIMLSPFVGLEFLIIVVLGNILLYLYSLYFKKIILLGNFTVSLLTGLPLVLGAMAVGNIRGGIIPAGFAILVNFSREIIKDMEDVKGDSSHGVVTFPQKVGLKKAAYLFICLIFALMVLTTIPYFLHLYKIEYFLIIMVLINPLFIVALKKIFHDKSLGTLRKVSTILKLNMILGLLAFLAGA